MSLLLRRECYCPTSLLPSAMTLLLMRTGLGIFSHLSALILVLVARVDEVPPLILLPQVVEALYRLLVPEEVPDRCLGWDPLLGR